MKKALVAVVIILAELSTFAYAEQPVDVLQKLIDQEQHQTSFSNGENYVY